MPFRMVAVLLCLVLLSACQSMFDAKPETVYSVISRKTEDRLEHVANPAGFTFLVNSPSGIGGATVTLYAGRWPDGVRVRLRYAEGRPFTRLEGFRVTPGGGTPEEVRTIVFGPDWAEVRIPPEFLENAGDVLAIEWVDLYRR